MSLKLVKRKHSSYWYISGTVQGKVVRESTGTTVKKKAEEYRSSRENELWQESIYGPKSVVTFQYAVVAYLEAEERSETTKFHLARLLEHFKDTRLIDIAQPQLDEAYRAILRGGVDTKAATKVRGVLTPLRAVLEFSAIRKWCDRPAFERPKVFRSKTPFLRPGDVTSIISNAAPHLQPLLLFLIGTGARASEALELNWDKVDLFGKRAVLWQKQRTERDVKLPPVVVKSLKALPYRTGRVFRPLRGGKLGDGYYDNGRNEGGQFKTAWAGACKRAGMPGRIRRWIPKGGNKEKQAFIPDYTPHILRHTWASWHYCLYQDILLLKEEGGWETVGIVTRYAKKMPDEYRSEIEKFMSGEELAKICTLSAGCL